jgi:hypothetical protein
MELTDFQYVKKKLITELSIGDMMLWGITNDNALVFELLLSIEKNFYFDKIGRGWCKLITLYVQKNSSSIIDTLWISDTSFFVIQKC